MTKMKTKDDAHASATRGEAQNTVEDLCGELSWGAPTPERRKEILSRLFLGYSSGVCIEHGVRCATGGNVRFAGTAHVSCNVTFEDTAPITIGDHALIGPDCSFLCSGGVAGERAESLPIVLGRNVWLGVGVTVLGGVTIGDDACIGSSVTVAQDVPAGATLTHA